MAHVMLTVNGMGSPGPWDPGFAGAVGNDLSDPWADVLAEFRGPQWASLYRWQPVAYPAQAFPMGPSVRAGVTEVLRLLDLPENQGTFALSGYSEGAMVIDTVWRDHILTGSHRHRVDDVIGIVNFGDPMRCPGVSNGNLRAGFPIPKKLYGYTTGGISGPNDLKPEETPDFLMSCNNDGDMYVSAPVGDTPWLNETPPGHDETLIFSIVQDFNVANVLAIIKTVIPLLNPMTDMKNLISSLPSLLTGFFGSGTTALPPNASNGDIVGFIEALLNAGMFFIVTGLSAHGDYQKMVPAMDDWLLERGHAIKPRG